MSRKGVIRPRVISPDPVHSSILVSQLINIVMLQGKKSIAEKIVYTALDIAHKQIPAVSQSEILSVAIENIQPELEVTSKRLGGATYQIPREVPKKRACSLALKWVKDFARQKKGKGMAQCLSEELVDAYNKKGMAIKKRDETHKMAESNRAFAHFKF